MKRKAFVIASIVSIALLAGTLFSPVALGGGNPILDLVLRALYRIESEIDSLNATVTEQQQQISELQSKLDTLNITLTLRIEALELNQSKLAERITALEDAHKPPEEVTFLDDEFETGLDNWSYWGGSGYVLQWVSNTAKISGDGYEVEGGMQKVVDISEWNEIGVLLLSFDWRATSDTDYIGVTCAILWIQDADSSSLLYEHRLVYGGTTDTGWQNCAEDISSYVVGHPRIRIILWLRDGWIANRHQTNAYDNIKLVGTTSPYP